MIGLFAVLLFLHVMGAIVAFGPTFAFGIYAGMAERDRAHLGFANASRSAVSRRLVVPGTLSMAVTGVLLIVVAGLPWAEAPYRWLQLSIALYVGAIAWNVLVTRPRQDRVAAMGREVAEARAPGSASGPPPEMANLIEQIQRDGKAMGIVVIVIVFLMVAKPAFGG